MKILNKTLAILIGCSLLGIATSGMAASKLICNHVVKSGFFSNSVKEARKKTNKSVMVDSREIHENDYVELIAKTPKGKVRIAGFVAGFSADKTRLILTKKPAYEDTTDKFESTEVSIQDIKISSIKKSLAPEKGVSPMHWPPSVARLHTTLDYIRSEIDQGNHVSAIFNNVGALNEGSKKNQISENMNFHPVLEAQVVKVGKDDISVKIRPPAEPFRLSAEQLLNKDVNFLILSKPQTPYFGRTHGKMTPSEDAIIYDNQYGKFDLTVPLVGKIAAISDNGFGSYAYKARKNEKGRAEVVGDNQDGVFVHNNPHHGLTFGVLDGMGGHGGGVMATKVITDTILRHLKDTIKTTVDLAGFMKNELFQNHLSKRDDITNLKSGSAVALVNINKNDKNEDYIATFSNAGDASAMHFRKSKSDKKFKLENMSKDHGHEEMMIQSELEGKSLSEKIEHIKKIYGKELNPENFEKELEELKLGLPFRNVVNSAVDFQKEPNHVGEISFHLKSKDIIVVASDGLKDVLTYFDIAEVLDSASTIQHARTRLRQLVQEKCATEGAKNDNISILVYEHR